MARRAALLLQRIADYDKQRRRDIARWAHIGRRFLVGVAIKTCAVRVLLRLNLQYCGVAILPPGHPRMWAPLTSPRLLKNWEG